MAQAGIDVNDIKTLIALSSSDGTTIVPLYADPTTHRLLVDSAAGGSGTVTSASVVTANGFAGSVATATTTPAITLSVTTSGILKGDGTSISAATAGTDYTALAFKTISVSGQSDIVADSAADTLTVAAGSGITLTTNASTDTLTIASTASGGTVTNVSVASTNGFAGTVATSSTTAVITISVTTTGILKGDGTAISVATADVDYVTPTGIVTLTNKTLTSPKLNENVAVTTTATRLNYITSAAGFTGTSNTNIVFSASPTFTGLVTADNITLAKITATTTSTVELRATTSTSVKISSGTYPVIQVYNPGASTTCMLDLALGNYHRVQMPAGNITMGLSNQSTGQCFLVDVIQDGTGSRTVTWFSTIKWAGGSAVTLTTTSNKVDTIGFIITATSSYQGYVVGQNI